MTDQEKLLQPPSAQAVAAIVPSLGGNEGSMLELWRVAAHESEDAIFGVDPSGKLTGWTPGATRLFGYQQQDVAGELAEMLLAGGQTTLAPGAIRSVLAGSQVEGVDAEARNKDGMTIPISLTLAALDGAGGVCAIARDLSERKRSEATVAEFQSRLEQAQRLSHVGLWLWNAEAGTIELSDELFRIHGIDPLDFDGRIQSRMALVHPADRNRLEARLQGALSGEGTFEQEYRVIRPEGSIRWVHERATLELDRHGKPTGLRGTSQDVTERRVATDSLARQAVLLEFLRLITEAANQSSDLADALYQCIRHICSSFQWPVGHAVLFGQDGAPESHIWHLDHQTRYARFRDSSERNPVMGGEGLAGWIAKARQPIWLADLAASLVAPRARAAAEGGLVTGFGFPVVLDKELVAVVELFCAEKRDPDPELMEAASHGASQLGRVVERARSQVALAHQAMHDSLTGLPNRTLFLDRLTHAVRGLGRDRSHLAVLFIDLDNFKLINDSLGHDVGDRVLLTTAQRLVQAMRKGDTAARFGGDEFIILCDRLSSEDAVGDIADRLLGVLTEPIPLDGAATTVVNGSLGIVIASSSDARAEDLIRDADAAMYRAKEEGRGRFHIFDARLHERASRKLAIGNELRQALSNREFRLVYQPQVTIPDGQLIGFEALIRWENPARGTLSPGEFIPVAEETRLIVPIGDWILQEACRQAAAWLRLADGHDPLTVSVNLSAVQLARPELISSVEEALSTSNLDPANLCLEITESVLMGDPGAFLEALVELRLLGVSVAVDDFGTGYSSLAYLRRFPIDVLKIDKGFVDGLGQGDHRAQSIVRAVVDLSHALGVRSMAEGVETFEQARDLEDAGCQAAQGYYFSRPQDPEIITEVLGAHQG